MIQTPLAEHLEDALMGNVRQILGTEDSVSTGSPEAVSVDLPAGTGIARIAGNVNCDTRLGCTKLRAAALFDVTDWKTCSRFRRTLLIPV